MWFTQTMGFHLSIKENEILALVGKWMELEIIMLSEKKKSRVKKDKWHMLS